MLVTEFFIQLVLILVFARVLGELAVRVSVPSVIGELFAGVLLGPSILGWVNPSETIHLLAQIGVVLLLFEVGLETELSRLAKVGGKATISAVVGVVAPFIFGFVISYYFFHLNMLLSLFIGSTLTATSIGITLRVLSDLKKQSSHEAQIVLGAAIIDDIIGIVLLSIFYEFSLRGVIDVFNAGRVLLFIIVFLVIAPIIVKVISSVIKRYADVSTIPGMVPTAIVSLLLFFSWMAHIFGAPELLGGFAAGLALSKHFPLFFKTDTNFSKKVEYNLKPIIHLFVPIFFVNIGLSLNLKEISWNSHFVWVFSFVILLAAIIGKLLSGFVLFRENRWVKWAIGIAMIPRGEVGLIFAEVGKTNGVFDQEIYATVTIVIAITTLLTPFALKAFYQNKNKGF